MSDTAQSRYETVKAAAAVLEAASGGVRPRVLVVLGSGLGSVVDGIDVRSHLAFGDLPGPVDTIAVAAGRLQDQVAAHSLTVYTTAYDDEAPLPVAGRASS